MTYSRCKKLYRIYFEIMRGIKKSGLHISKCLIKKTDVISVLLIFIRKIFKNWSFKLNIKFNVFVGGSIIYESFYTLTCFEIT